MLNINHLSFSYEENLVIENVSFEVKNGEILGILGLNGAGKSTLLNLVAGFLPLAHGTIQFQYAPLSQQSIAMLETHNYFYPHLTAQEYLHIFIKKEKLVDIQAWAAMLDIPLNQEIENFSTGMKKKLALLSILILDRPVMIFDEPFNGLDLESSFLLKEIILKLKAKGKIILLTSHVLETLTGICDRILWLKRGNVERIFEHDSFGNIEKILKEDWTKLDTLHHLL
ncbi:ABC transporter ATP-binding protein [Flectobacillus rivi]|uniref:ATP-binding cassette domain-containing protein n=1 Tax=Flectobacillus rivi TaxID=2984209 RepID=A0ABT6YZK7_9BACT|nr:ATP-binding cassette domain-containing protein [Flectobacillus rivi]MDI9873791.1 ATP-binding cassette domain-containing protein [Flectobacillus rivi]